MRARRRLTTGGKLDRHAREVCHGRSKAGLRSCRHGLSWLPCGQLPERHFVVCLFPEEIVGGGCGRRIRKGESGRTMVERDWHRMRGARTQRMIARSQKR